MLAAELPSSTVTAPTGTVTVGADVGLIGQLLTYQVVDSATGAIAEKLLPELGGAARVLIVHDSALGASDWAYASISQQLEQQETILKKAADSAAPSGLNATARAGRVCRRRSGLGCRSPHPTAERPDYWQRWRGSLPR
jgi:hypothetical protein